MRETTTSNPRRQPTSGIPFRSSLRSSRSINSLDQMTINKAQFDWRGIALVLLLVSVSLWVFVLPTGFDIALPIAYGDGDSLQSAAYIKRILQTHWFPFRTELLGAPFGAAD